jgi:hypothetical protein
MVDTSTSLPTCTHCGAEQWPGAAACWVCGRRPDGTFDETFRRLQRVASEQQQPPARAPKVAADGDVDKTLMTVAVVLTVVTGVTVLVFFSIFLATLSKCTITL